MKKTRTYKPMAVFGLALLLGAPGMTEELNRAFVPRVQVRVATEDGAFFLLETSIGHRRGSKATDQLAFWNDSSTGNLYVYGRTLNTDDDIRAALFALEAQLGPYLDSLKAEAPELFVSEDDIKGSGNERPAANWSRATLRRLHALIASSQKSKIDLSNVIDQSDGNVSDVLVVCEPCPQSGGVEIPARAGEPDSGARRGSGKNPVSPSVQVLPVGLVEAIQAACCSGGGGGTGGCTDNADCTDDGNRCTNAVCSAGSCFQAPVAEPCCDGSVAATLGDMELALAPLVETENLSQNTQLGEPTVNLNGTEATAPLTAFDETGQVRAGSVTVGCGVGGGSANLVIDVTNNDGSGASATRAWTLTQAVVASGGSIAMWGDITIVDVTLGTSTLVGGWTWSQAGGAQLDPASDPGFQDAVAEMINLTTQPGGAVAGLPPALGSLLQWLVNVLKLPLNYILDLFIPYTPPAPGSCSGPSVDGTCGPDDVVCQGSLAEMCESVGDIPGVSTAFKKCMKGRCGCGGSSFPRARITCNAPNDCGPCAPATGGLIITGCSTVGTQMWYCQPSGAPLCACAQTIFHEMSHACGSFDDPNCDNRSTCPPLPSEDFSGACRTGIWFQEQCCAQPPSQ